MEFAVKLTREFTSISIQEGKTKDISQIRLAYKYAIVTKPTYVIA